MRTALTRRRILGLIAYIWTLGPGAPMAMSSPYERRTESTAALGAFLDTLLPEDSTPSATQLRVDAALRAEAASERRFARLLRRGCEWLDEQAQERGNTGFADLDDTGRAQIVRVAEASRPGSLPSRFFRTVRDRSFRHYYANAASWKGLGFDGPPQPVGFPGYTQPPEAHVR